MHISTKTTSFSSETLVINILGCTYDAHDAVEDCKYLQKLVKHSSISFDAYYLNYNFTTSHIMSNMNQMENTKSNLHSLMPLITGKVESDSMLKKSLPRDFLCTNYIKHTKENCLMVSMLFLQSVFEEK